MMTLVNKIMRRLGYVPTAELIKVQGMLDSMEVLCQRKITATKSLQRQKDSMQNLIDALEAQIKAMEGVV